MKISLSSKWFIAAAGLGALVLGPEKQHTPARSRGATQAAPLAAVRAHELYGKLPLSFETNRGQAQENVDFIARGPGYSLFLRSSEAVFKLRRAQSEAARKRKKNVDEPGSSPKDSVSPAELGMSFIGANAHASAESLEPLLGKVNYFIGNDPAKWLTNVPTWGRVLYADVYPGIDIVYYGNHRQLEYDVIVSPGGDWRRVSFRFTGADDVVVEAETGDLLVHMDGQTLRQHRPIVYQEVAGDRRKIRGDYVLASNGRVGFEVGDYDRALPLIIDPVLVYSTYLGGDAGNGVANAIAVDSAGNAYVTGYTNSGNPATFPTTPGAFDTTYNGSATDAFVTKFNATGTGLIYSTFLGGSGSGDSFAREEGIGIAVDSEGNAYVTGSTNSFNFPTTPGAFDTTYNFGNADAFVTKLNATGSSLIYSTFLGGSGNSNPHGDEGLDIAVDSAGNAYVVGDMAGTNQGGSPPTFSTDFPTTPGAFDTTMSTMPIENFVAKLNPAGSSLVYSTLLNGSEVQAAIAVDAEGNAYVTGTATFRAGVTNFPTTGGAFDPTGHPGDSSTITDDTFVTKFNATGTGLVYSTFLGGDGEEQSGGIAVDSAGNAYVTGHTGGYLVDVNGTPTLTNNFPTTSGAFDTTFNGHPSEGGEAFVTKFNATGSSLVYSTYLGGSTGDAGKGIAVDSSGNAYVTGSTNSTSFPTTPDASDTTYNGDSDAFVTTLNATGSGLIHSTFLGGSDLEQGLGIAVDSAGNAYVTGFTYSEDFRTTPGAFDTIDNDGGFLDAFVAKIGELSPSIRIVSITKPTSTQVLIQGMGVPEQSYSVNATEDLAQEFVPIGMTTEADENGIFQFQETPGPNVTKRFYSIVYP